ncbi:phosphotransferase family protein [Paenibacillus hodogayensis]|uniref:Phosphotransferase family protein n=1 Tax=Paenibacillus hodogayensis TaxID=279208 RepID=A0ABV5VQ32_9BACL
MYPLEEIHWVAKDEAIDDLLEARQTVLPAGLEADVWKLSTPTNEYVLKIWCKDSKPDVSYQYAMLQTLHAIGVSVSRAFGWGMDHNQHKVLLTSYDGRALAQGDDIQRVSKLLAELHRIPIDRYPVRLRRQPDFVKYFFPRIDEHPDIAEALHLLLETANMKYTTMIHGDYNLGNVLAGPASYTIIDWTNAQLGDPRYDFCWASFLIRIDNDKVLYQTFIRTYLLEIPTSREDLARFESIACLRWLLLNRIGNVPKNVDTDRRIQEFLLQDSLIPKRLSLFI